MSVNHTHIDGKSMDRTLKEISQQYMDVFTPPEFETPPTYYHQASLYDYSQRTYTTDSTSKK